MNIVVFQLVNYTLAFLMYMIIGRGMLTLIIGNRQNFMLLAMIRITEPIYRVTRTILPFATGRWVPILSFFMLAAVRLAMILLFHPAAGR